MSDIVLTAESRIPGKKIAKQLRTNDRVPGVYYGNNAEPVHFSVPTLSLRPVVYTSKAKVISLEVDGKKGVPCILKDVSFDPITDSIVHFDLLAVAAGHKIQVEIPLHLTGQAVGVRNGGVLEQVLYKARVMADPTKMPERIDVDITSLDVNQSIHISHLSIAGIEFLEKGESVVVTCVPHRAAGGESATDAAATADAAAPQA